MNKYEETLSTNQGDVLVKVTDHEIQLHVPSKWDGRDVEDFRQEHKDRLNQLRPRIPVVLRSACYHVFRKAEIDGKKGLTYNPWSKEQPKTGFAVGLTNNKLPSSSKINGSPGHVEDFLKKHALKLKLPGMYMGSWYTKKDCFLDLVKVIVPRSGMSDDVAKQVAREEAVELGRAMNQQTIYCLEDDKLIVLSEEPILLEL